ncbi:hypothetical protein PVK06_012731 [Gossypium arboreum]|uniref:Uncharacterized protein n=1 Tax=Gossypium arboreum TaxID=29729 RepID=A0ABR0QC97_GOSAR|nr:hypothetical protein PVK06_012731 [Gossypium arboreum]
MFLNLKVSSLYLTISRASSTPSQKKKLRKAKSITTWIKFLDLVIMFLEVHLFIFLRFKSFFSFSLLSFSCLIFCHFGLCFLDRLVSKTTEIAVKKTFSMCRTGM